jgi:CHU_C Type IX secretion signal domain
MIQQGRHVRFPGRQLPVARFLLSPSDGGCPGGQNFVFTWDTGHLRGRASLFSLRVVPRHAGQAPEDALRANEPVLETVVQGGAVPVNAHRWRDRSATYAWQVTALKGEPDGALEGVAASEIRTFRLADLHGAVTRWLTAGPPEYSAADLRPTLPLLPATPCFNGDLETGTLQGWQAYHGSRLNSSTIYLNNLQAGVVNGRHTIRTLADGFDPVLGGSILPQVGEGSYSVRLGNAGANGEADVLSYTFVVNPQNQWFAFRYAVVLQDPQHDRSEQPFFSYYVLRGSSIFFGSHNLPVAARQIVADADDPFLKSQGSIVYRGWTPTCLDLRAYLGETMTIVFATADCAQGAHFGYAYIDGLCRSNQAVAAFMMPEEICPGASLIADGSASANETSCFWSIEESDASWGRHPATEVSEWFVAQQAGSIDLTAFYAGKGGSFQCNRYYRVKLAVSNDCTPWNETVRLLHVRCPPVTAGPDLCVGCTPGSGSSRLGKGNPAMPGTTYVWTPAAGLDYPFQPSPLHAHGSVAYPATYTVTATDASGCRASDQVTLYCRPPTLEILVTPGCCSATLTALATGHESIVWSTGETGVLSIQVTKPGTYSATVANPCGTVTQGVTVPASSGLTGFFNPIAANSIFYPDGGGYADKLYIKDVIAGNGVAGTPNAYNATQYRLEIFDRWGELFRTIEGESCSGFLNWDIAWDGTDGGGSLVPQGVYTWMLHFKNCQYREWTVPLERRFAARTCIEWATFLGIKLWCKKYDLPDGATVDVPLVPGSVTVIR